MKRSDEPAGYENSKLIRRPSGTFIVDGVEVAQTIMCAHCGCHFRAVRGKENDYGFCMECGSPTCGLPGCHDECLPFERRLELYEKGKLKAL